MPPGEGNPGVRCRMAKEYEDAGKSRGMTPGHTRALMVLVAVITGIAIWLVPVDEEQSPPSLPELPSASGTTEEPLALPSEPGMPDEQPSPEPTAMSGTMPPPSEADAPEDSPAPSGQETTAALALPPPPGGIATVTGGGEGARTFLYELQTGGAKPDPAVVFAEAERQQAEGNREDAYLLYRFAARHGHTQAAMTLGTQADPAYHAGAGGYLPEPEPGQAYKWYSMAAAAGEAEAGQRLQALRQQLERDAAGGDEQAGRLLLQWR